MSWGIRPMLPEDVDQVVGLQKAAFPPPFSEDLHWDPEHLLIHIDLFPQGQFVAESEGKIVGSCSNTVIDEARWLARRSWYQTVGGPDLDKFAPNGTTLYGLDITVHPDVRRQGVGRAFYETRFELIRQMGLVRYGTGCRMPDFRKYEAAHPGTTIDEYASLVVEGKTVDRTLTPLLRYNLRFLSVIHNYMPDEESANAGALLEGQP